MVSLAASLGRGDAGRVAAAVGDLERHGRPATGSDHRRATRTDRAIGALQSAGTRAGEGDTGADDEARGPEAGIARGARGGLTVGHAAAGIRDALAIRVGLWVVVEDGADRRAASHAGNNRIQAFRGTGQERLVRRDSPG